MNVLTIVIFIGLSAFMLFLFFYMLKIEKTVERKFAAMEMSLEELNKEMFTVKKSLKQNESLESVKRLENIIENLVDDVRFMEDKNREFYEKLQNEIESLKLGIKKSSIPDVSVLSKHEEEKIISLYKSGYSIEEISRELRIPAGEIELIVKFSSF